MQHIRTQRGISVIEVLIGIAILALTLVFINHTISLYVVARDEMVRETAALYLAEEGYEIVRALRDDDWSNIESLALDTDYALSVSTTTIGLGPVPEVIDEVYRRRFHVRALYRDGSDQVVASTTSGATADSNGRELWIEVGAPSGTTTLRAILTDVFPESS